MKTLQETEEDDFQTGSVITLVEDTLSLCTTTDNTDSTVPLLLLHGIASPVITVIRDVHV